RSLFPSLKLVRGVAKGVLRSLAAEIRKLGGEPASGGSVSGALYRVWTDLVSTLSGHSEKAVLEQCERAEDEAKKIYEKAIALDLPPAIKSLVTQQFASLKENHDRIRKLRDELGLNFRLELNEPFRRPLQDG